MLVRCLLIVNILLIPFVWSQIVEEASTEGLADPIEAAIKSSEGNNEDNTNASPVTEPEDDDDGDEDHNGIDGELREGYQKKVKKIVKKVRKKPVFVQVPVKKSKAKDKIITILPGMYISGGQPIYGKFKSLKSCAKACSKNPSCFSADYDKWLHKCFIHSNITACARKLSNPALTHMSKVPCTNGDLPTVGGSRIVLGAQMYYGYEQKGIDDLKTCIKKCLTQGNGLASSPLLIEQTPQLCVAINFDFSTHKCYFYPRIVNGLLNICATTTTASTIYRVATSSKFLVKSPFVVTIFLCPNGQVVATK